ncbi:MAG: putative lipid flippase MurJ [Cyanobacteriota bacterium erpe_2018_sw_21hr_WHONDRS-SW48-000092_B_bin.40]|nr:putative lipid flippase MurJ [Cyanobacteriota bacterium erpe_2018_sw_21hr_WHONDRS-SW48-000092_B_bin.40]
MSDIKPATEKANDDATPGSGKSLAKTFSLVALFTLLSKFAGLARDMIVGHAFGLGIVADAYNYAYSITGTILVLFGGQGGPFHTATFATLTKEREGGNGKLVMQMMAWTAIAMGLIALLVYIFAPIIVQAIVPGTVDASHGYSTAQRLVEVIKQVRIMAPLIMIAGLVGIGCGISNTYNEHFWPSIAPAFASGAIITFVLLPHTDGGVALALGTLVGGIGQLAVQIPGMLKSRPCLSLDIFTKLQPGMKEYLVMFLPLTFSTSIGTLIGYVDQAFSSGLVQGGWSAICNANRLVQLPLGILVTAMLVPIGPIFAKHVTAGKIGDLKFELKRALTLLWFLALPVSALLLVEGRSVIKLLFEKGAWTANDTEMVTSVLLILTPMIFFYVARDLLTRVFYAFQDSRTPFAIAVMAILVKIFLDWLFVSVFKLGIGGIALATTLITIFNLSWLYYFLRKKTGRLGTVSMIKPLIIMVAGSGLCGLASYLISNNIPQTSAQHLASILASIVGLTWANKIVLALNIGIASSAGLLLYTAFCYVLKLEELRLVADKVQAKLKISRARP